MKNTALLLTLLLVVATGAAFAAAPDTTGTMPAAKTPSVTSESMKPTTLTGKVLETMNAGGYTYVHLQTADKKTWIAVPETTASVGQELSFYPGQMMTNFHSKTLNRTFDEILFSAGVAAAEKKAGPSLPSGHPALPKPSGASGSKAQTEAKDPNVKVEKAKGPNAYTIAEIYKKRIELNKKTVMVRGKAVKVSEGILGKNWIHLQDGTGDQQKGTHNLVVTSVDSAEIGDVVTVTGTMSKDRDFGAGYLYKVIIEDAKVEKN